MSITGTCEGEQCSICGRTMEVEDCSFSYEYGSQKGVEKRFYVYCEHCDTEEDYDNEEITHCSDTGLGDITYRTFYTPNGVIVTAGYDIICELTELNGDSITELISSILGCEQ